MVVSADQLKSFVITAHLANKDQLDDAERFSKNSNTDFGEVLVQKGILTDEILGKIKAAYLKLPFITLSALSIPEDVVRIIPSKVARRHQAAVFSRDQAEVKVAMADPNNRDLIEMLSKKTGQKVSVYLATGKDIYNTLGLYRRDLQTLFNNLLAESMHVTGQDDAPVAKIVDLLFESAYEAHASDVHIEAEEKNSLARFRIDGILRDVLVLSKTLHERIVTRIKVLARLRTDEHLAPQDGKIGLKINNENVDIRVSILPMVEGEKVALRILSSSAQRFTLKDLGMNEKDLGKVENAYSKPYGMILSTGPTGSGKTTSIYAVLKILNTKEKNITTIEDPVEYRIKGVNQIQVNPKTNLTFAAGLRSILRQDPNIIFVGEIRDKETAAIAVNAALTGHLVLSTLHTNDAPTALPRLIDMEIEPFLVASTVNIIIGQRLVRKICPNCREEIAIPYEQIAHDLPRSILDKFTNNQQIKAYRGRGCKACHSTGYLGRIGIFEVLEITEKIRKLITEKKDSDVIRRAAIDDGMTTMMEDGLNKTLVGITTIEEVLRATKVESK